MVVDFSACEPHQKALDRYCNLNDVHVCYDLKTITVTTNFQNNRCASATTDNLSRRMMLATLLADVEKEEKLFHLII